MELLNPNPLSEYLLFSRSRSSSQVSLSSSSHSSNSDVQKLRISRNLLSSKRLSSVSSRHAITQKSTQSQLSPRSSLSACALAQARNVRARGKFIELETMELDWLQSLRIAAEISQGMVYLHQKHIVHRDLKPHNVLVSF